MLTVTLLSNKFLASDKLKGVLVLKDLDEAQAQALLTASPLPISITIFFLSLTAHSIYVQLTCMLEAFPACCGLLL